MHYGAVERSACRKGGVDVKRVVVTREVGERFNIGRGEGMGHLSGLMQSDSIKRIVGQAGLCRWIGWHLFSDQAAMAVATPARQRFPESRDRNQAVEGDEPEFIHWAHATRKL